MTTKPLLLTPISLLPKLLITIIKTPLISGGWGLMMLTSSTAAQDVSIIAENLPSPPQIVAPRSRVWENQGNNLPTNRLTPSGSHNYQTKREYTFSAPSSSSATNQAQGYRVEVFGDSDTLLTQVRDIEPKAFRKGDIIQVGIFSDQANAEDLVRKLALKGFWARIVAN